MRLFLCAILGAAITAAAPLRGQDSAETDPYDPLANVPAPLREAVKKVGRDAGRWAYTVQTLSVDRKGRTVQDEVARYDPSQHYDVQWTLLMKDGKPATEAQIKKHRKDRAKLAKNRRTLGELLELTKATELENAPGAPEVRTYVVPISREGNSRFPVDKVEVLIRVRLQEQELESIELRLKEAARAMLVAKVKSGRALLKFEKVDAKFAPPLTLIKADFAASIAFFPVQQTTEQTRTEFKRVKPYDERFEVKLGPLKTIDF